MTPVLEALVGNRSAVQVLLFLEACGSAHASRIASTYEVSVVGPLSRIPPPASRSMSR